MWPLQTECDKFYGDPRGKDGMVDPAWVKANLIWLEPPFDLHYAGTKVTRLRIHRKCAGSLARVFQALLTDAGSQDVLDAWGVSQFGGSFNYRLMRGGNLLSMHSYGCAVDLDPGRNPFNSKRFNFSGDGPVVKAFEAEGWEWGGRWRSPDAMHFQAARTK